VDVTDDHVMMRVSPNQGFVIPKRVLRDPADADRIVALRNYAQFAAVAPPRTSTPPPLFGEWTIEMR
jgi:hypothetical protein